eukprot:Sdes_comp20962_c1_seq3m18732
MNYLLSPGLDWATRNQKKENGEAILKSFTTAHKNALDWILGSSRQYSVAESLTGYGSAEWRHQCLKMGTAIHLSHLDMENPLRKLLSKPLYSSSPDFILNSVKESYLMEEFEKEAAKAILQGHDPPTRRTFLQARLRKQWARKTGPLFRYTLHAKRSRCLATPLFDMSPKNAKSAIGWRLNTTLTCCKCVCGEVFNRKHLDRCSLLDENPWPCKIPHV